MTGNVLKQLQDRKYLALQYYIALQDGLWDNILQFEALLASWAKIRRTNWVRPVSNEAILEAIIQWTIPVNWNLIIEPHESSLVACNITQPQPKVTPHNLGCVKGEDPEWPESLPKEGLARVVAPILLLVRHRLFRFFSFIEIFFFFFFLKNRCHTKRRMGAAPRTHPCFGMTMTQDIRCLSA